MTLMKSKMLKARHIYDGGTMVGSWSSGAFRLRGFGSPESRGPRPWAQPLGREVLAL